MSYLWSIWDGVSGVVMPFTFLATVMLSVKGLVKIPEHRIIKVLSHEGWCIAIVAVIPWHIVAFGRGEISPVPWNVFSEFAAVHGMREGITAMLIVCIVDLWLLWTPAQMYAHRSHPADREKIKFVRIINGLAGLLLFTPNNPLMKFLQLT